MIYTCIKYPLPGLVNIFYNDSRESTVHNNWWMFTTFMLGLDLSFFFKTLQIQISQLPTWSGPTHFSSLLVNACSLITDNIWEKYCIYVYDYSDNYVLRNASHIYACTHPDPQFKVKRPPLAFAVAEMSGPKRPRPKLCSHLTDVTLLKGLDEMRSFHFAGMRGVFKL